MCVSSFVQALLDKRHFQQAPFCMSHVVVQCRRCAGERANGLLLRSIYLITNNIINKSQVQRKVNRKGCHKGLAPSPPPPQYPRVQIT